jgi:hypothetical protein
VVGSIQKVALVKSSTLNHLQQLAKIHQTFQHQFMQPLEDGAYKKAPLFVEVFKIVHFLTAAFHWKTMSGFLLLA